MLFLTKRKHIIIMENEEAQEIVEGGDEFDYETADEETIDWKAEALKQRGIANRYKTKLDKSKEVEVKAETKTETKTNEGELDYGQLAYLAAKNIEDEDQITFIKSVMQKTGDDLKTVLKDDYVLNRIKAIKEERTTKEAMPSASKRATPQARDTVDYWINKGELPPADQPELRRKVVNERVRRETEGSKFSSNSVVIA